jgi:hypothetical protein
LAQTPQRWVQVLLLILLLENVILASTYFITADLSHFPLVALLKRLAILSLLVT